MKVLFFILIALGVISCQKDSFTSETPADGFTLSIKPLEGQTTKTANSKHTIKRINYYLVDHNNNILDLPYTSTAADMSFIRIENIKNGSYRLIVLGESSVSNNDDVSISKLNQITDDWLTINSERINSLQQEYYYTDHHFTVKDGVISNKQVEIPRIMGRVSFNIRSESDFVALGAIKKIEIISVQNGLFYSMKGDGEFRGAKLMAERVDITDSKELKLLPTTQGKPLQGRIAITAVNLDGKLVTSTYTFKTDIIANSISTVNIEYKHPDDGNRLLYIPFAGYDETNSKHILSDTESKSVYYSSAERSFNVKSPLQYGFDSENKFFVKFYSAVGISNVKFIWDDGSELLEFARFDTIPPFFETHLTHPLSRSAGLMKATDGRMVERKAIPNMTSATINLSMHCEDPYMQKIKTIIPSITLQFASYGGNPDAANGAPSGNWMGIRPVHIREACAAWTNMAFMVSTQDFLDMVNLNAPTGVYKNNSGAAIDANTIINQYRANRTIIAGLIWTGNQVVGLGGGTTWGVSQKIYFNHYSDASTMWHELGHCVGYSHSSTMAYGTFAEIHCRNLHTNLCVTGRMPVSYKKILNSDSNPNRY